MKYLKGSICPAALLALILLLTACQTPPAETSEPTAALCTLRYMVGDTLYAEQTLEVGQTPQAMSPQVPGLLFRYWTDAAGKPVRTESTPLTGDTTYTAFGFPDLGSHNAFLFPDADGLLRPEAALTANDLSAALTALAAEGAADHFPRLPSGPQAVTPEAVIDLLGCFFPESAVTEAFAGAAGDTLPRGEFAAAMCVLLGRTGDETLEPPGDMILPGDITEKTDHAAALLEASVPHTPAAGGRTWAQVELPSGLETGFVNLDGWLYYVQEDGHLLRDGSVGLLEFGSDGRYTCGDPELDAIVAGILDELIRNNPDKEGLDLLHEAFYYCRDSFEYLRKGPYGKGALGWEVADAKEMFTTLKGNCYNYAASFWALARGLGYQARAISGTVTGSNQPHGWVFIEIDGADYIFDTEWEMAYRVQQLRFDMDMFMIPENRWYYWNYQWWPGQ